MRKLALALAAATILAGTVPASAQSFYAGVGWGPGWGYDAWGWDRASAFGYGPGFYGPSLGVGFYGGGPVVDSYAYVGPRYRARRVVRTTRVVRTYDPAFSAYAYSPYAYAGPSVSVGFGFGPGWGHRWW